MQEFEKYYAVIFTSKKSSDDDGYAATAKRMLELAQLQPGFISVESAREALGITISYWRDLQSIKHWKHQAEHQVAQAQGQRKWYDYYHVRICEVVSEYSFQRSAASEREQNDD